MKIRKIKIGEVIGNKGVVKRFKLPEDVKIIKAVSIYAVITESFADSTPSAYECSLANVSVLLNNNTNQAIIDYLYQVIVVNSAATTKYVGQRQNKIPAKSFMKNTIPLNIDRLKNSFGTCIIKLIDTTHITSAKFYLYVSYE